jgi:hypothetical protein
MIEEQLIDATASGRGWVYREFQIRRSSNFTSSLFLIPQKVHLSVKREREKEKTERYQRRKAEQIFVSPTTIPLLHDCIDLSKNQSDFG